MSPRIQDIFASRASLSPEAVALECGGRSLTFRELGVRSDRLAESLAALGIGPETMVGICLDRSPDYAVALLAILKAGGVVVPISIGFALRWRR